MYIPTGAIIAEKKLLEVSRETPDQYRARRNKPKRRRIVPEDGDIRAWLQHTVPADASQEGSGLNQHRTHENASQEVSTINQQNAESLVQGMNARLLRFSWIM